MFSNSYKCVSRKIIALILIYLIGAFPVLVYALPQDGEIVSGSGTIKSDGAGKLTVNQTSQKIAINWKNFSIGKNESVVFLQPNISSSALNNINGSQIGRASCRERV